MNETLRNLSFVFSVLGYIPFITAILWKNNRQNPVAWLGFWLINSILLASNLVGGSYNLPIVAYEFGIFTIFALSIKYGEARFGRMEQFMLLATLLAMALWRVAGKETSVLFVIMAVYVSSTSMWGDQYTGRSSQPSIPWILWLVGSLLQLASKGHPETWKFLEVFPTLGLLGQQMITLGLGIRIVRK
jgi:hypothetical protein